MVFGISMVVASFALGGLISADYCRFAKNRGDVVKSSIVGVIPAGLFMLLTGGVMSIVTGQYDISAILASLGVPFFGLIALVLATWTTNDNNLYQSVLGLTNACHGIIKLPRWITTAICGIIATILGAIGMIDWLVPFLNILSVVVPPITGAMLADFYILKNADSYKFELMGKIPNVRPDTSIGAIAGCLVGFCMNEPPIGFGVPFMVQLSTVIPTALVAMACSVVVVLIVNKLTRKEAAQ